MKTLINIGKVLYYGIALLIVVVFVLEVRSCIKDNVQAEAVKASTPRPQPTAAQLRQFWCATEAQSMADDGITGLMAAVNPKVAKRVAKWERKCAHLF